MEAIVLELCSDTQDPYDRSLCLLVKSGRELIATRAWRLRRDVTLDQVMSAMTSVVHRWSVPHLGDPEGFHELLEELEESLTEPF